MRQQHNWDGSQPSADNAARKLDAEMGSARLFDRMMLVIQRNTDKHGIKGRPDLGLHADHVSAMCLLNCQEKP